MGEFVNDRPLGQPFGIQTNQPAAGQSSLREVFKFELDRVDPITQMIGIGGTASEPGDRPTQYLIRQGGSFPLDIQERIEIEMNI